MKVARDCDHNKSLFEAAAVSGKSPRNLLYDINVIINGEHRATWRRHAIGRGYYLAALEGRALQWPAEPGKRNRHADRIIRVAGQSLIDQTTRKALDAGVIPERAQSALHAQREHADFDLQLQIGSALSDLYVAATMVLEEFGSGTFTGKQTRAICLLASAVSKARATHREQLAVWHRSSDAGLANDDFCEGVARKE